MTELSHRIRVFAYRVHAGKLDYLLLKSAFGVDGSWSPIHGPIGFGEQVESAVKREVRSDTGISKNVRMIDLDMPSHWVLGDEEVVEWNYGFRVQGPQDSLEIDQERFTAFRWLNFTDAYPSLILANDRAAILRLHHMLGEAC
jgi:NADH pyrophosphatase NudC (nudix superfamily)